MKVKAIVDRLKEKQFRLTKARMDILNLLSIEPMDMHTLEKHMKILGHPNVQTIYNNISFLESQNCLFTTLEQTNKIFPLVDYNKNTTTHINIRCHANQEVFHISKKETIEALKKTLKLDRFKVNHLDITIQGECAHIEDDHCELEKTCMLKDIVKHYQLQ